MNGLVAAVTHSFQCVTFESCFGSYGEPTVEEVSKDLLDGDYDSDDDFGGYFDDSGDNGEGSGEQGASGGGEGDGDSDGEGEDGQGSSGSAAGIPEYRRQKGCTTDMSNKSQLDFFKLLITDAMLQQVVEQTILFAQQHIEPGATTKIQGPSVELSSSHHQ